MTYPAARARQLTALEAYKVRARDTPTRVRYPISPDRSTPTKAAGGRFTDASQFDDGATDRSPRSPPTRESSTRPRRPRRGSPAERPAPHSP